jgi:hypothetical protein
MQAGFFFPTSMLNVNDPFPTRPLPSSKGGTTDLKDVFAKGTTIVGVIPAAQAGPWLEAVSLHFVNWMMERFWNVYLILDVTPEEARFLCDEYGVQATILCDNEKIYLPNLQGVYKISAEGVVEKALGLESGSAGLADL